MGTRTYTMWCIPVSIFLLRRVDQPSGVSRSSAPTSHQKGLGKQILIWFLLGRSLSSLLIRFGYSLIVPYLTTAAMSLFLNILIHPLDHTAQLDLETLISVANTVRNTLGGESTHGERSLLQGTSDFVMRLVWLGTCAVTKATRTERV